MVRQVTNFYQHARFTVRNADGEKVGEGCQFSDGVCFAYYFDRPQGNPVVALSLVDLLTTLAHDEEVVWVDHVRDRETADG